MANREIQKCCKLFKPFSLATFLNETKELLKIGWILSIFMLLEYMLATTSMMFCGRLGQSEMAAAGMAQSIISIFCFMPGYGMVTVCNTYFSTGCPGSRDDSKQVIILQKALLLSCLVTLLCWAILINTEEILYLIKQDEEVTFMVGQFVRVYLPAVPALFASFVLSRFLQCRNHVMVTMIAMMIAAVVNILLNYIFLIVAGGGVSSSSAALVISQYTYLAIICTYLYKFEQLTGWSTEALEDWYEFTTIGVHGCLMVELEILVFEAGYFLCVVAAALTNSWSSVTYSGTFDALAVGVFGAVYIMIFYTFMICSGVASALAIRIGCSLGKNKTDEAGTSMQVSFLLCWIYALIVSVVFLSIPDYIGYIFTNDKEVIEAIAKIIPILAIFEISDLTSNIAKGAIQGCGRQSAAALIAFISYYFVALPVSVYLVMFQKLRAKGMWIGLCIGNALQAILLLIYTFTINWEKEAELSQERMRITKSETTAEEPSRQYSDDASSVNIINKINSKQTIPLDIETATTSNNTTDNDDIILNQLNMGDLSEKSPLVCEECKGFRLSRRTIYIRVINVAVALTVCLAGIIIYYVTPSRSRMIYNVTPS